MVKIRLLYPFTYHHLELPAGEIIEVSRERANRLVSLQAAEYAEPQHAVIEPEENRSGLPFRVGPKNITDIEEKKFAPDEIVQIKRPRGRPRKDQTWPSS